MSEASLIRAMPDLVMFLRPDGRILEHFGGRTLPFLRDRKDLIGHAIDELVEPEGAAPFLRLIRRAIADRNSCEAQFQIDGARYLVRIHPQGPKRVMCVMRQVENDRLPASNSGSQAAGADGFVGQLLDAVVEARLREHSFALCVIFLAGLADIGELIDFSIRQRILDVVVERTRTAAGAGGAGSSTVGIIDERVVGALVTGGSREAMRSRIQSLAASIRGPVDLNGASFVLAPHIGVAVFGEDASHPQVLLDNARAAMCEARRREAGSVQFYSDTVRMLPVLRLDIERELREAIQEGQIKLHYRTCHDLTSGQLAGVHAYLRWTHPLRGEIPPAQFLRIAETTDLALAVSRAGLERLALDLPSLRLRFGKDFPICFAPLRHHLSTARFLTEFLDSPHAGALSSGGLVLRIAERTLSAMSQSGRLLDDLTQAGVGCVIDELGSGTSSVAQLAQLPISALQITRRFVVAAAHEPAAMRTCRAIVALAEALEVPAIAPGIDDEGTRARMCAMGCSRGLGDLYPPVEHPDPGPRKQQKAATRI